ncbi:MAG: hypothetical protein NTY51_13790 [Deltaproteobacteria bacterium]|nr:hypothetical protein [Deltaproteobacteria bacterium]
MKTLTVFLSLTLFCIALATGVQAAGAAGQADKIGKVAVVNYNAKYKCVMVCKGQKPILETLEDGLAYALDLPLALLSPITCPIMTPLLEKFDSDADRTYAVKRIRK